MVIFSGHGVSPSSLINLTYPIHTQIGFLKKKRKEKKTTNSFFQMLVIQVSIMNICIVSLQEYVHWLLVCVCVCEKQLILKVSIQSLSF